MVSYLLLRSNKESGPYSLEELVANGLKPYDLVWVKGKSAAWRYPSEIDELKSYSTPIEEQPFDRFYKKSSEIIHDTTALQAGSRKEKKMILDDEETPLPVANNFQAQLDISKNEAKPEVPGINQDSSNDKTHLDYQPRIAIQKETEEEQSQENADLKYQPQPENSQAKSQSRKSVFVTLPGQRSSTQVSRPVKKEVPGVKTDYIDPKPIPAAKETAPVAEIKYSQPLDEIKEMYVKTLQDRKTKSARSIVIKSYLQKAAVVAGLVGVGVLVGFIMKPKSATSKLAEVNSNISASSPIALQDVQNTQAQPTTSATPGEEMETSQDIIISKPGRVEMVVPEKRKAERPITGQSNSIQQKIVLPAPKRQETDPVETESRDFEQKKLFAGAEKNPVTGERSKTVRDEVAQKEANTTSVTSTPSKPVSNSSLAGQVTVKSNDYKIVAFGGIRDLRLTVTNNSKVELENVIVELQYLKPSEQPLRTEKIEFRFIGPNESSTIRVPDTNRGIKVAYKIISIGSKQTRDAVAGM